MLTFHACCQFIGIEGDEKSSWHVDKDGLRRTLGRKESFGWPNVIAKKVVPTRNLRTVVKKSAPPAPTRNKATTQRLLLYLQSLPDAY